MAVLRMVLLTALLSTIADFYQQVPDQNKFQSFTKDCVLVSGIAGKQLKSEKNTYQFRVTEVLHPLGDVSVATRVKSVRMIQDSCGTMKTLTKGNTYTLSGPLKGSSIDFSICNSIYCYKPLTNKQKQNFKVGYAKNSNCKVEVCYPEPYWCKRPTPKNNCPVDYMNQNCWSLYSLCQYNPKAGRCEWSNHPKEEEDHDSYCASIGALPAQLFMP